jgi:hypothetical protein
MPRTPLESPAFACFKVLGIRVSFELGMRASVAVTYAINFVARNQTDTGCAAGNFLLVLGV